MAQIVQKQIYEFDTLENVPNDAYLILQTQEGVTVNTTKGFLLSESLSISGGSLQGNLIVNGDLTINGNTTSINTTELTVEDNIITLNKNVTGIPSLDAGLNVNRGNETDASLIFNETNNRWELGVVGDTSRILTEKDSNISRTELSNVTNSIEIIDTFSKYIGIGSKWIVVIDNGVDFRISEILSTWDATNEKITFTETSATDIGDTTDVMFAVDITSLSVNLLVSINSGVWNFKVQRTVL